MTNSDVPSALASTYSTPQINQALLLYQGTVEIQVDSQKLAIGKGNVCLDWLPLPAIKFQIDNAILDVSVQDFRNRAWSGEIQLLLVDSEVRASAHLNQFSCLPYVGTEEFCRIDVVGGIDQAIWSKSDRVIEYISGCLVNFPELVGDWVLYSRSNMISRARAVLTTENWKITIDGVSNISKITKELRESGGYAITSLIKIERPLQRDSSILLDDTNKIIEALYFFLSFAVGRYNPVVLPIGFDSSDREIWYEWKNWLIPQWEKTTSWFSGRKNWDSLAQLFPGFMKKLDDSTWCDPIRRSIIWYVESNNTTADPSGRIIWIQSALELLSWTYFVSTKRKTKQEFKSLGGMCEKIKAFLKVLNIPTSFSDTYIDLRHLERFIEDYKGVWKEKERKFLEKNKKSETSINNNHAEITEQNLESYLYLKAFVEVRNDIVHPEQRSKVIFSPYDSKYEGSYWIRIEALKLGLWYLELSLLSLFEYRGNYVNRLKSGEVETVPWAEAISR